MHAWYSCRWFGWWQNSPLNWYIPILMEGIMSSLGWKGPWEIICSNDFSNSALGSSLQGLINCSWDNTRLREACGVCNEYVLSPIFSSVRTTQILNLFYTPHSSVRFLLKSEDYSLKKQSMWGCLEWVGEEGWGISKYTLWNSRRTNKMRYMKRSR